MVLLSGLAGGLVALLLVLALPLRFSVTLRLPGRSDAEVRLFGVLLARWRDLGPPPRQRLGGEEEAKTPSLPTDIGALGAMLRPLRRAPVDDLRLTARGSTGSAASTAVLYGLGWAVLGSYLAVSGLRPRRIALEPVLEGPAGGRIAGGAAVRVRPYALLRGAVAALLTLSRRMA